LFPPVFPALAALVILLVAFAGTSHAAHQAGHPARSSAAGAPGRTGTGSGNALDALLNVSADPGSDSEFLRPEEAFRLSARGDSPATAVLEWALAPGYYLYRKQFRISLPRSDGGRLGPPEFSPGQIKQDAYFGKMEVYYDRVSVRQPILGLAPGQSSVRLEVRYQGCADAGLCYPPQTRTMTVDLGAGKAGGAASGALGGGGPPAEQDELASALATGHPAWVLLVFYGLGLLLAFTPCVLPMLPILVSIVIGQGDQLTPRRAFGLSSTYVLAMAVTYTVAGVAAALSGANVQAAFQNPWLLGAFAALFVALAFAMFGLYTLQIPQAIQTRIAALSNRQRGGTYGGVAVMGLLSALIVGPCVAAPLAGALIYIAGTGDASMGGAALFALSLGMGTPLIVIGTSGGKILNVLGPRLGPLLDDIKRLFGFILIGVAIYLLERVVAPAITLGLWSALAAAFALYVFGRLWSARPRRLRLLGWSLGSLALLYGAVLAVGAATGGRDPLSPLSGLRIDEQAALQFLPVKGTSGLDAALRRASAKGRPVMVDFYADWCVTCKELERETFTDPTVRARLASAMLLRADITDNDAADQALLKRFGLFGPPAILFFGPDGAERNGQRVIGFLPPKAFLERAEPGLYGSPSAHRRES